MNAKKIIKAINETPISDCCYRNNYISHVEIFYNGMRYVGNAWCSPEDADFSSKLVGCNIAYFRAKEEALNDEIIAAKMEYQMIKKIYCDVCFGKEPKEVDPTGRLKVKMYRAENKYNNLKRARKELREELRKYITDQNKVIESLKRQRQSETKVDKNN